MGKNGGTLKTGNPGNKGGPGRPPNELRDMLRAQVDEIDERIRTLMLTADLDQLIKLREQALKYGIGTKLEATGANDGPLTFTLDMGKDLGGSVGEG